MMNVSYRSVDFEIQKTVVFLSKVVIFSPALRCHTYMPQKFDTNFNV